MYIFSKFNPVFQGSRINFVKAINPVTTVEERVQLQRLLDAFCIQASHVLCHLIQDLLPLHVQISSSFCSILVLGCLSHAYSIYLIQDSCHPISMWIIGIASIFSLL